MEEPPCELVVLEVPWSASAPDELLRLVADALVLAPHRLLHAFVLPRDRLGLLDCLHADALSAADADAHLRALRLAPVWRRGSPLATALPAVRRALRSSAADAAARPAAAARQAAPLVVLQLSRAAARAPPPPPHAETPAAPPPPPPRLPPPRLPPPAKPPLEARARGVGKAKGKEGGGEVMKRGGEAMEEEVEEKERKERQQEEEERKKERQQEKERAPLVGGGAYRGAGRSFGKASRRGPHGEWEHQGGGAACAARRGAVEAVQLAVKLAPAPRPASAPPREARRAAACRGGEETTAPPGEAGGGEETAAGGGEETAAGGEAWGGGAPPRLYGGPPRLHSRHSLPSSGNWVRMAAACQQPPRRAAVAAPPRRADGGTFGAEPRQSASCRWAHQTHLPFSRRAGGAAEAAAANAAELPGSFLPLRMFASKLEPAAVRRTRPCGPAAGARAGRAGKESSVCGGVPEGLECAGVAKPTHEGKAPPSEQ
ncbi:hypothetical protein AB1Y20_002644 [Prymnesium parvum]|uniref:Uncharacterized protein n=1 Tax=Prymnesium parvum TaxID=97485 RepID=A0AB34JBM2_PRYPA